MNLNAASTHVAPGSLSLCGGQNKGSPHPTMSTGWSLEPMTCEVIWQMGITFVDKIKFAIQLTSK